MAPFPDDDINSCDSVPEFPDSFPSMFKNKTKQKNTSHIKPYILVNISENISGLKLNPITLMDH